MDAANIQSAFNQATEVRAGGYHWYKREVSDLILGNLSGFKAQRYSSNSFTLNGALHDCGVGYVLKEGVVGTDSALNLVKNSADKVVVYANVAVVFPIAGSKALSLVPLKESKESQCQPKENYNTAAGIGPLWARVNLASIGVEPDPMSDTGIAIDPNEFPENRPFAKSSTWVPLIVVGGIAAAWIAWSIVSTARANVGYRP